MKGVLALGGASLGFLAVPFIALLALTGVASTAVACSGVAGGELAADAPIPIAARGWVAIAHLACPVLPSSYIAAMMSQESSFGPDAYADDSNGGTWGLLQVNASIWLHAYGAPWTTDLNCNGVWDIKEPEVHYDVGCKYLCDRLAGVRAIRARHPDWASTRELTELDALVVAHNAGEGRLRSYPRIPRITARYVENVRAHMVAWAVGTAGSPDEVIPNEACTRMAATSR